MDITQEKITFQPITITLNTREEAEAFFDMVSKVDLFIGCANDLYPRDFSSEQRGLLIQLSNAITNNEIII